MTLRSIISRVLIPTAVALLSCGCQREVAPASITCDQIRALRLGMTIADAEAIVGPALQEELMQEPMAFYSARGPGDEDVLLVFSFDDVSTEGAYLTRLTRVLSRKSELFDLNEHGLQEFPDFERVYCPNG